jgi:hypothetical protein
MKYINLPGEEEIKGFLDDLQVEVRFIDTGKMPEVF